MRSSSAPFAFLAFATLVAACGDDAARVTASSAAPAPDAAVDVGGSRPDKTDASALADASADGLLADASTCMTCPGASMPTWQLADVQPLSPGYGKTYGLEAFKGKVTVVALLASW